jgi:hypothetical protein
MSRTALGPTQPAIQWVQGFVPADKAAGGLLLTTHLQLMLRLKMSGAIPLLLLHAITTWMGTTLPFTQE